MKVSPLHLVLGLFVAVICTPYRAPVTAAQDNSDASGAGCVRSLTLEEFKALAFEKSPLVADIDSEFAQQVAHAFDTEVLANPELQAEQVYTRMKIGGADDPQTNASLGQRLRLSNFGTRAKVAALLRRAGDAQKRAKLLEFSQKLALQFYTLRVFQKSEAIIADSERRASRQIEVIHEGVTKGLLSEGDHKLFEGEKFRLQAQRKGLQSSIRTFQAEIVRTIGIGCTIEAKGDVLLPPIPHDATLLAKARESEISEAARADLLYALSAEQVRLAELDAFPELTPRLVYQHTNDGGDFVGAGISIPIPFFNRNQSARTRAEAEQNVARRRRDVFAAEGLEGQVRALRGATVSAAEQADLYSRRVVPAFSEALRSQERLYAQGKGSVLQVWQTLRTSNEAQVEALRISLAAVMARMQLSLLVGEEI